MVSVSHCLVCCYTQDNDISLVIPQQVDAIQDQVQDLVDVGNEVMWQNDAIQGHVQDDTKDGRGLTDDNSKSMKSFTLVDLPTELLVKILSYLPTRDKIMIQYAARRFQDFSEIPLLWKEFNWADYEPRHQCSVSYTLKRCGKYVRQISFPAYVTPTKVLEMVHCCKEVTHLSLPEHTKVSMHDLEAIVKTLTYLRELKMFAGVNYIDDQPTMQIIEGLLKAAASSVRELKLRTYDCALEQLLTGIQGWASRGYPLPSVISIFSEIRTASISEFFKFWLASGSNSKLPSFEIRLYDDESIPIKLYPPVLLRRYKFGSTAAVSLIRLSSYGIVGLKHDIFHFTEYNHYGTVRHALTPERSKQLPVEGKHIDHSISCLHSVSYIDVSFLSVHSDHLKQFALVCPNLQFLNLGDYNGNCLKDLRGLHTIVCTCQNLTSLNLEGIPVSLVESSLSLWELLSTLKKLAHLSIELCMLYDRDNAKKKKLITIFKHCHSIQALEIQCRQKWKHCIECDTNGDFLFSHFPSLQYCKMCNFRYPAFPYLITNCHQLKYLHEFSTYRRGILPFSNNCYLQALTINSSRLNLTDESLQELSAHGELERAYLCVRSITIRGITILIKNSPNLIGLSIVSYKRSIFNERDHNCDRNYTDRVREMFPHHKLFVVGQVAIF